LLRGRSKGSGPRSHQKRGKKDDGSLHLVRGLVQVGTDCEEAEEVVEKCAWGRKDHVQARSFGLRRKKSAAGRKIPMHDFKFAGPTCSGLRRRIPVDVIASVQKDPDKVSVTHAQTRLEVRNSGCCPLRWDSSARLPDRPWNV
jgi:hypothetical protein